MVIKVVLFLLATVLLASLIWIWIGGIDYMKKYHPDYKGEDFLDWDLDEQDKNEIS